MTANHIHYVRSQHVQSGVGGNQHAVVHRGLNVTVAGACCLLPDCAVLLAYKQICVHITLSLDKHCAAMLKFELIFKLIGSKFRHLYSQTQSCVISR